jgi:CRP/FNR family transcriptional regulator
VNFREDFKNIFEPELLQEIEQRAKPVKLKAGDVFIEIGQTARQMPIMLSGSLNISRTDEDGRELLLYYVNAGESCAMTFTCCMQHYPSEIRAVAEEDAELLALPVTVMDEWMSKYPTWKSYVMKTIRGRFNELLKTIDQVAFQNLDDRLIIYLKEKSKVTGSSLINLSHEQIARELNTSRVVISRLLKKLENDKKVLLYRNQIKLLGEL